MRALFLVLAAVVASGARSQGVEEMQGTLGAAFPAGPTERRLEVGWSVAFGGIYWFSGRLGFHSELGVHRFDCSDRLRNDLGSAKDGLATIVSVPFNGIFRLHQLGDAGFYVLGGLGIYNRRLELSELGTAPILRDEPWAGARAGWAPTEMLTTTRGGLDAGLGWEMPTARGHFLVEIRYHRIFTRGLPTEFIPVVVGSRF